MFYCQSCADERGWPEGWAKSRGPCELCAKIALCSDRPSSSLPLPKATSPKVHIHTITAYGSDDHSPNGERRVFGYFETRTLARNAVMRNDMDMHENLYIHLVIEAIAPGIHSIAGDEEWFCWTKDYEWFPCEQPEWARRVCNHAMG